MAKLANHTAARLLEVSHGVPASLRYGRGVLGVSSHRVALAGGLCVPPLRPKGALLESSALSLRLHGVWAANFCDGGDGDAPLTAVAEIISARSTCGSGARTS